MQNVFTLEINKYKIKLENFEGPLDLLCHLIDENKMDIYDISISEITDQYIDYINMAEQMNLEITSEFLVMASNLLYIKSKKLLPRQEEEEEMLSEEELIRRIIEYKQYKEITNKFREMYSVNNKRAYRLPEAIEVPKRTDLEVKFTVKDIYDTYKNILNKNANKINHNAKNIVNKLFPLKKCKPQEVVTAFSGLLEMSRRSKVVTKQEELFGEIDVDKKARKI